MSAVSRWLIVVQHNYIEWFREKHTSHIEHSRRYFVWKLLHRWGELRLQILSRSISSSFRHIFILLHFVECLFCDRWPHHIIRPKQSFTLGMHVWVRPLIIRFYMCSRIYQLMLMCLVNACTRDSRKKRKNSFCSMPMNTFTRWVCLSVTSFDFVDLLKWIFPLDKIRAFLQSYDNVTVAELAINTPPTTLCWTIEESNLSDCTCVYLGCENQTFFNLTVSIKGKLSRYGAHIRFKLYSDILQQITG